MRVTLLLLLHLICAQSAAVLAIAAEGNVTGSAANGSPEASSAHPNDDATSNSAGGLGSSPYTATKDLALWLDRHNWLRGDGLVWPAAGMVRLTWDAALAVEAHAAIQICTQQPQDAPGLHVFVDSTPGRSLDESLIEDAIQVWGLDELFSAIPDLEIPMNAGDAVGKGVYSRYSQLVWANTTRVGCAYAVCAHGRLAACRYSPVGNSPGRGWYEFGRPCSRCPGPAESQTCFDSFCVSTSTLGANATATATLSAHEVASTVYQKHKVRSLQLTLDSVAKRYRYRSGGTADTVMALSSGANSSITTLCNNASDAMVIQEQLSLLNLDGGLSPVAVVFGLFLGVSVILVMIVCIMHSTKPKKKDDLEQQPELEQDKDPADEPVQPVLQVI